MITRNTKTYSIMQGKNLMKLSMLRSKSFCHSNGRNFKSMTDYKTRNETADYRTRK